MTEKVIGDGRLLADLRRVARAAGRCPRVGDYRRHGRYSAETLSARFGGWRAAVEAAGLRYVEAVGFRPLSERELAADVRRVADDLGRPPLAHEYNRLGRHRAATLTRRTEGRRWWQVLVRYLGLSEEEARRACWHKYRKTDERLDEVRALARRLRRAPSSDEGRASGVNVKALVRRLGSWAAVIEAAGLGRVESKSRPSYHMTDEELREEVRRVAREWGRFPGANTFDRLSKVSSQTVMKRLGRGKWSGVRALFSAAPHLGSVPDPEREFLKGASVEAVKDFFKHRRG